MFLQQHLMPPVDAFREHLFDIRVAGPECHYGPAIPADEGGESRQQPKWSCPWRRVTIVINIKFRLPYGRL